MRPLPNRLARHLRRGARQGEILDELSPDRIDPFFYSVLDLGKGCFGMSCPPLVHPRQHILQLVLPSGHYLIVVHLSVAFLVDD
jgi:hypothetical protein